MGSNYSKAKGNYWTSLDTWPEPVMTNFYLKSLPTLGIHEGTLEPTIGKSARNLTFAYDPKNPVQTQGGNNLEIQVRLFSVEYYDLPSFVRRKLCFFILLNSLSTNNFSVSC